MVSNQFKLVLITYYRIGNVNLLSFYRWNRTDFHVLGRLTKILSILRTKITISEGSAPITIHDSTYSVYVLSVDIIESSDSIQAIDFQMFAMVHR